MHVPLSMQLPKSTLLSYHWVNDIHSSHIQRIQNVTLILRPHFFSPQYRTGIIYDYFLYIMQLQLYTYKIHLLSLFGQAYTIEDTPKNNKPLAMSTHLKKNNTKTTMLAELTFFTLLQASV